MKKKNTVPQKHTVCDLFTPTPRHRELLTQCLGQRLQRYQHLPRLKRPSHTSLVKEELDFICSRIPEMTEWFPLWSLLDSPGRAGRILVDEDALVILLLDDAKPLVKEISMLYPDAPHSEIVDFILRHRLQVTVRGITKKDVKDAAREYTQQIRDTVPSLHLVTTPLRDSDNDPKQ